MAVFTAAATLRVSTELGTVDQDLVDENGVAIVDDGGQQIVAGGQKAVLPRLRAVGRASPSITTGLATDGLPLGMQVATSALGINASVAALPTVARRLEVSATMPTLVGVSALPRAIVVAEAGLSVATAIAADGLPKGVQVATSLFTVHAAVSAMPRVARLIEAAALIGINSSVVSFAVGGTRYHAIKLVGSSTPDITLVGEKPDTEGMTGTVGRHRAVSPTSVKLTGTRS